MLFLKYYHHIINNLKFFYNLQPNFEKIKESYRLIKSYYNPIATLLLSQKVLYIKKNMEHIIYTFFNFLILALIILILKRLEKWIIKFVAQDIYFFNSHIEYYKFSHR